MYLLNDPPTYPSSPPAPNKGKPTEAAMPAPAADCPDPAGGGSISEESFSSMSVKWCDGLSHLQKE